MEHREDRDAALVGESPDHLVQLHDVPDVEVRRGLVEEEHRRVLRERLREHRSAPLPAGELVHRAVREVLDADRLHRLSRLRPVLDAPSGPSREVRSPAHQHELEDVEGERRDHVLRDDGDETSRLLRGQLVRVAAGDPDRAGGGLQRPAGDPHERRLPAAVRSHQPDDLSRRDRERDIP